MNLSSRASPSSSSITRSSSLGLPPAEYDSAMYWHLHGVVSCHFNRAEEASRSYRESLRLAPSVPETGQALHALGKVDEEKQLEEEEHAGQRLRASNRPVDRVVSGARVRGETRVRSRPQAHPCAVSALYFRRV